MSSETNHNQLWYVSDTDVARLLGVSVATVRRWRLKRTGPTYVKFGSTVRYDIAAVEAWARAQEVAR